MRALECKRRYENLRDDCNAEQFIYIAHKTAMSIKNVAKGLSPDSSTRLMAASFTPRQTRLKHYVIPKDLPPDTLRDRVSPSSSWHHQNFPEPSNKPKFVIGCEPNPAEKQPKVIDQITDNESKILITTLQVAKVGPKASKDLSSRNTVDRK